MKKDKEMKKELKALLLTPYQIKALRAAVVCSQIKDAVDEGRIDIDPEKLADDIINWTQLALSMKTMGGYLKEHKKK